MAPPAHAGNTASADLSGAGATASSTSHAANSMPPVPELQVLAWQALTTLGDMCLEGRTIVHCDGGALMPVQELVQHIVDTTVVMGFGSTTDRTIKVTMDFCTRAHFSAQELLHVQGLLTGNPPGAIHFPPEPDRDTILRHLEVYNAAMVVLSPLLPPHLLGLWLRSAASGDQSVAPLRGLFRALPITLQLTQEMVTEDLVHRSEQAYAHVQTAFPQDSTTESANAVPPSAPAAPIMSSETTHAVDPAATSPLTPPMSPGPPLVTTHTLDPAATSPRTPPRSPSPPVPSGNYQIGTHLAWEAMGDSCHRRPPMPALLPGTKWVATRETNIRAYVVVPKLDTQPSWWKAVSNNRTWTTPADRQAEYAAGDLWSGQYPRRPKLREGLIWDPISSRMLPNRGNVFRVCSAPSPAALTRPRSASPPRRSSDLPAGSRAPTPRVPSTPSSIARYLAKALTLAAPQPPHVYTTKATIKPQLVTTPPAPIARQRPTSSTDRASATHNLVLCEPKAPQSKWAARQHQTDSHPPSKATLKRDPNRPLSVRLVPPLPPASPCPGPPAKAPPPPPLCSVCGHHISPGQLAHLRTSSVHPTQWMCTACTLKDSRDAASSRSHAMDPPVSAEPPVEAPSTSRLAPPSAPKPSKAPSVPKPRSPGPHPSPSQAKPPSNEATSAGGFSLGQFLDLRRRAIALARDNVAHITSKRADTHQKLSDLVARQAQALRSEEPAARKIQTAQAMAGLIAARESELAQVGRLHTDATDTLNQLRRQKVGREAGVVAVCDNCCQYIFAAQLPECLPGPRSEALLHCPTCSANPSLH